MRWRDWLRTHVFPVTQATAQYRVDALDHALANLRAKVVALPLQERLARAADVQALIAEQAHARNVLSDKLDDRRKR